MALHTCVLCRPGARMCMTWRELANPVVPSAHSSVPSLPWYACAVQVVDVAASSWCVLEDQQPPGRPAAAAAAAGSQLKRRPGKLLSVTLAVPEPTGEEVQYKKGEGARCAPTH